MKEIILIESNDDGELYARKGFKDGSKAVLVIWGYATGSNNGQHNMLNTFAIAMVGTLVVEEDEKIQFEWSCDYSDCEGWDDDDFDGIEVNWDKLDAFTKTFCDENL